MDNIFNHWSRRFYHIVENKNEKLVKSYQWALRADSCALTNPFLSDIWRHKITNMQWWLEYKKHFFAGYCRKKWETLKQYHWIRILKLYSRALDCFPPKNPRKTANTKLTFEEWRQWLLRCHGIWVYLDSGSSIYCATLCQKSLLELSAH